jgi:hypothetical protein
MCVASWLFFAAALMNAATMRGQAETGLQVMPLPAHSAPGEGQFLIDGSFGIALEGFTEPRLVLGEQRHEFGNAYSILKAFTGSIEAARRAGMSAAIHAATMSGRIAINMTVTSIPLTS